MKAIPKAIKTKSGKLKAPRPAYAKGWSLKEVRKKLGKAFI